MQELKFKNTKKKKIIFEICVWQRKRVPTSIFLQLNDERLPSSKAFSSYITLVFNVYTSNGDMKKT